MLRPKSAEAVIQTKLKMATRQEIEKKKSVALQLYLAGQEQKTIADQLSLTAATVSRWANAGHWREQRAARTVTRPQLVNKILQAIDALLDKVLRSEETELMAGVPDKLAKRASTPEKLDKKANVVDTIEVFVAFSKWMEFQSQTDREITPELLATFNKYQNKYIIEKMNT